MSFSIFELCFTMDRRNASDFNQIGPSNLNNPSNSSNPSNPSNPSDTSPPEHKIQCHGSVITSKHDLLLAFEICIERLKIQHKGKIKCRPPST